MKILLLTPPFTQLNTPYPATAYLQGFLKTIGHEAHQADLGIEVILKLFCRKGLQHKPLLSENSQRICQLQAAYLRTIDPVITFLQHKNPTLAHAICDRSYLPEGGRFAELEDLEWAFGTMGTQDQARHFATLYLEDLGDLITEAIDPHFGFSRYAERLGRTATHFDELAEALLAQNSLISEILVDVLAAKIAQWQPEVVGLTVPFPGNLFGAFKCGQFLHQHFPEVKVVMGGGFANTELRRLRDPRVFDFVDYVALDDGEAPFQFLLEFLDGRRPQDKLKRIFLREKGQVVFVNGTFEKDIPQRETGTPDYADLPLRQYLSVIEIVNPMHRLWSDGRWNKLTLAHGCYWGKCSFCDVSLDYIQRYEPMTAALLCDRIEEVMAQTGENGFHFVDEAAPPALMRDLALEILRRGLTVVWWTNIRFEKSFTPDLCRLLKASGCIAVSGGLEVASDRLLAKMKKGVTVAQVARVADAFTEAGIMVHAYLMYGFPTQTAQETIDALEMVRQLFEQGAVQSGYWHRFAMTAHSPVGLDPAAFGVLDMGPDFGGFADNDRYHDDPAGADHDLFSEGLRKSLFNYMQGAGFELPLKKWFGHKVPRTSIAPDYIAQCLEEPGDAPRSNALVIWLGEQPTLHPAADGESAELEFIARKEDFVLEMSTDFAVWLSAQLGRMQPGNLLLLQDFITAFEGAEIQDFEDWDAFWESGMADGLREGGMLLV
jgi:Radical SAM superfamily